MRAAQIRAAQTGVFDLDIRISYLVFTDVCTPCAAETGLKCRNVGKRINACLSGPIGVFDLDIRIVSRLFIAVCTSCVGQTGLKARNVEKRINAVWAPLLGPLRPAFLAWISEFPIDCFSMCVRHVWPKQALNPETSKKNKRLSERPYCLLEEK
jgi:hypothetical protein